MAGFDPSIEEKRDAAMRRRTSRLASDRDVRCAVSSASLFVILVERIQHGFQELHEACDATDILRWTAPLPVDERRVLDVGLAVTDRFDEDFVPPVVPEVVHVEETCRPRGR